MIQIKPTIDLQVKCPEGHGEIEKIDFAFTGMHTMLHGRCLTCSKAYFFEVPINAGAFYPGILDARDGKRVDDLPMTNWYLEGLEHAYKHRTEKKISVEILKFKESSGRKTALLNTLDQTYGHSLYELFNASYYIKQNEHDIIVMVQREFVWLLPEGIMEAWVFDLPFKEAHLWFDDIATSVKRLLLPYTNVHLIQSFVQADDSDFSIYDYVKIKPFPLEEWDQRLLNKPVITFIWRHDRFWKRLLPKYIDNTITNRLFPVILKKINHRLQHNWILNFAAKLRKEIPNVDFAISGMDSRAMKIPDWIKDYRYPQHQDQSAKEQIQRYAESHIVLGCNGSSLVLPACMAGALVNISPFDAWAVSAGTFPFRITSIGDTHFRNTLLPPEVSLERLSSIVTSILRDRSLILLHTTGPWRDHTSEIDPFEWSKFRVKAFHISQAFKSSVGLVTKEK